jgi:glycosyltransferase involved in cell wall biosynthesis
VYRRATLALLPSEREGFGLPLVVALSCGTPVQASALGVLREVGGEAAGYCPVADVPRWRDEVIALLTEREQHPDRWRARKARGLARAAEFSWSHYAARLVELYTVVAGRPSLAPAREDGGAVVA